MGKRWIGMLVAVTLACVVWAPGCGGDDANSKSNGNADAAAGSSGSGGSGGNGGASTGGSGGASTGGSGGTSTGGSGGTSTGGSGGTSTGGSGGASGGATTTASSFPAIYDATGLYQPGSTLTVDVGWWNDTPTFTYQWYRADGTGAAEAIPGATGVTYLPTSADAERIISCHVTGTTSGGSSTTYALGVLITAAGADPVDPIAATQSTAAATTATFSSMSVSASILPNPERGGMSDTGYNDMIDNWQSGAPVSAGISAGKRLGYCMFDLNAFTNSPISSSWLATFDSRMNSMRSAGMKCVMMFYYDKYSGSGADATASTIVSHISQLKPHFRTHADVIAFFKGGFIGAWGEWHSSSKCNSHGVGATAGGCTASVAAANRVLVRNALLDAVHPLTAISFRYPADVGMWYPTVLTAAGAYSGSAQSRVGISNDCQLSGPPGDATGDTGTWWQWSGSLTASQLRSYGNALTSYTPYGGELSNNCASPQRTSCSEARADFAAYHQTFLKNSGGGGDSNYRNQWAAGGCTNEMENMQGYRLQLDTVSHQSTAAPGESITATIALRNVGWGRVQHPRKIQLVLTNGGSSIVCDSRVDLRALPPQATSSSTIVIPCTIPADATPGSWTVHLRMPDPWSSTKGIAAFAIRPANANSGGQTWDAGNFRFTTGTTVSVN